MRILINGVSTSAGVNTIRSLLKMKGVDLYGTDTHKGAVGLLMLPKEKRNIVPFTDDPNFLGVYHKLVKKHKIDWIISTLDEESIIMKKDDVLKNLIACSDSKALRICKKKDNTYTKLKGVIPVPTWQMLDRAAVHPTRFYSVKQVISNPYHEFEVKGLDMELIRGFYHRTRLKGLVCEHLPGPEYSVNCLGFGGKMMVAVPIKEGKETENNVEIINYCQKIYDALCLNGATCIKFKQGKNKRFKLIEISLGFGDGLEIVWLSGVDLPKIFVKYLMGKIISQKELGWEPTQVAMYTKGIVI